MNYVIYTRTTGRIVREYSDFAPEPWAGESMLETELPLPVGASHYVVGGELVPYPPEPAGAAEFDYAAHEWVLDYDGQSAVVRGQRDEKLARSDWVVLSDVPMDHSVKELWLAYRQGLRDITAQHGYPFDVVWPEPPI